MIFCELKLQTSSPWFSIYLEKTAENFMSRVRTSFRTTFTIAKAHFWYLVFENYA